MSIDPAPDSDAGLSQAQAEQVEQAITLFESTQGFWLGILVIPTELAGSQALGLIAERLMARGGHVRGWRGIETLEETAQTIRALSFDDACRHPSCLDLTSVRDGILAQALAEVERGGERLATNHPAGLLVVVMAQGWQAGAGVRPIRAQLVLDLSRGNGQTMHGDRPVAPDSRPVEVASREDPAQLAEMLSSAQSRLETEGRDAVALESLQSLLPRLNREFGTAHPFASRARQLLAGHLPATHPTLSTVLERQLEVARWVLGRTHPHTLAVQLKLAALRRSTGDAAGTLPLLQSVAADLEHAAGREHRNTLRARLEVALALEALERHEEARQTLLAVVAIAKRALDVEDSLTAASYRHLARVNKALGRDSEAADCIARSLSFKRATNGSEDPQTVQAMVLQGVTRVRSGNASAGLPLLEEALQHLNAGVELPNGRLVVGRWLAKAYSDTRQPDRAIPLLEDLLAGAGDAEDEALLSDRATLASAYLATARLSEAIHQAELVLSGRERVLGHAHARTVTARTTLGAMYFRADRFHDAAAVLEQALPELERLNGSNDPGTLILRTNLGRAYEKTGDRGKAIGTYRQALSVAERVLGVDHQTTRTARSHLTNLLRTR